jgi:hypothetical protein
MAILLNWHLGLGDAIICNGLVRYLYDKGEELIIPYKPHNEHTVKTMFNDLLYLDYMNANDILLYKGDQLVIGYQADGYNNNRFDQSFYMQAGVPFKAKWTYFKLPFDMPKPIKCKRFIHDKSKLRELEGWRPPNDMPFFDCLPWILGAEELHCMDSSFANLIDLMELKGKRFFYPLLRTTCPPPIWGAAWEYIYDIHPSVNISMGLPDTTPA